MQPEGRGSTFHFTPHDTEKHAQIEPRHQFERSLNYNYIPSDLVHANMGTRGQAAVSSYESQLVAPSNYSAGTAAETMKTETLGRGSARPLVSPYTGGERFLQPFVPG